jgi:hypothetical protein
MKKAQVIKVKNIEVGTKEVYEILVGLKEKQKEIKNTRKVYYSKLSYYHALKYNMFFKNLLLHPLVLRKKWFSEEKHCLKTKKEIKELLRAVIEYELMVDVTKNTECLAKNERDIVIKVFGSLLQKKTSDVPC